MVPRQTRTYMCDAETGLYCWCLRAKPTSPAANQTLVCHSCRLSTGSGPELPKRRPGHGLARPFIPSRHVSGWQHYHGCTVDAGPSTAGGYLASSSWVKGGRRSPAPIEGMRSNSAACAQPHLAIRPTAAGRHWLDSLRVLSSQELVQLSVRLLRQQPRSPLYGDPGIPEAELLPIA